LEKRDVKVINQLNDLTEGHVLYFFEDINAYINNIIDFVISGLDHNQYSLIIENDRIVPLIEKKLAVLLNESQISKVKFINNYDFYFANGDFACNSIFDYLPRLYKGYNEQEFRVRSWAHIEWGDISYIHNKLTESEKEAEIIVSRKGILSVCAYDSDRMSEELKTNLQCHHNFLIRN